MAEALEVDEGAEASVPSDGVYLRRAFAAIPTSIVIFFVTLLFTVNPAVTLLRDDAAEVLLLSSFSMVVVATVVVVVLSASFSLTLGRRLDRWSQQFPGIVAALIFAGVGVVAGLVASVTMLSAVSVVDGTASGEVFLALLLVLAVPAAVSGAGTRLVVAASAENTAELVVSLVIAAFAIGLFWWLVADFYAVVVPG